MPARLVFLFFALVALVLPAAGCEVATLGGPRLVTMEVGPKLVDCTGNGPRKCMMVRREGLDEWQLFYSGIEGFEYREGYVYRLLVEERDVENPPADGSSIAYRLVRLVSKTEARVLFD